MPRKWLFSAVAVVLAIISGSSFADCCPYCPTTDSTLSDKLASSSAACVVKFLKSQNGEELSMQTTTFEVVEPLPGKDRYQKGALIETNFGVTAKLDDFFLLLGELTADNMEWSLPIPLDELWSVYRYLIKVPSGEGSKTERLTYFLKFIDHENSLISNDAFGEFTRAEFNDVAQLTTRFSRTNLRKWLDDPNPVLDVRRAFYGMVLGLCGNDDDATYLEKKILAPINPEKYPWGIDGMMGGFLMLRGQSGLRKLVEKEFDSLPHELAVDDRRRDNLNALSTTLVFLWDYRLSQFKEESLRAAMRRFLQRPEFGELAIVHLSRWKDWASIDYLMNAYGNDPWQSRSAKEKIIAFALRCQNDAVAASSSPEYKAKARRFLDSLDPTLIEEVRRHLGSGSSKP